MSQRFLLPMDTGGKIRTGNILKQLSKRHRITLISNVESPKDDLYVSQTAILCSRFVPVRWKEVEKRSLRFFARLTMQMFSPYPVTVMNDYSERLRQALEKTLREGDFDLAICDFVQSALLFWRVTGIPLVLFQHNVESIIPKRHMDRSTNTLVRFFWWLQWIKMKRFEKLACKKFDTIIAVSEKDKEIFESLYSLNNVDFVPTGVDVDYFKPFDKLEETSRSLVFCGSMDWLPNEDAMVSFVKQTFPLIRKELPDATLTIVGRNPSPSLKKMAARYPGIVLTGWVSDIRPCLAKASVVVVPIRIGGGTRMKIYEAMAMGKPVVSTTIGAEGLPVKQGQNIVIADNPDQTANGIIELLSDGQKRKRIGQNALSFVKENFGWSQVARRFENICRNTADGPRRN